MKRTVVSTVAAILFLGSLFVLQGVFGQQDSFTIEYPGLHKTDMYQGVQFGHKKHADTLKNCKKCHHTYKEGAKPQKCTGCHKRDSKVTAKKAFHNTCRKCHRDLKKTGKATGPTLCTKCHAKKKK
ncbi:MAG: cytochrome c3 family protein [Thermodesulfobacteriota bacterium]